MLKKIRIVLAALFFTGITLLFLDFTGTLHTWLGWMAKVQFLPAVLALNVVAIGALVVLTVLFGRIYCSVVCPLGVLQDLFEWMGRKVKRNRHAYSKPLPWLRYGVLALFVIGIIAGLNALAYILEPYSAYGRIAANVFQPLYIWVNNLLAAVAERYDSYAFYEADVWMRGLPTLVIAVVTLVVLAVLAWRGGRTYCNTICPVGTVLGLLARNTWLRIRIDTEKCHNCSLCAKNCKASCIDFKNHQVDYSRCVVCGDCIGVCHSGAITYSNKRDNASSDEHHAPSPTDPSKRSFLLASALLTTAAMAEEAKKTDGGLAEIEDKVAPERQTKLTPPGSLSARNMANHCTGCQLCVAECPNGVLRPSSDWLNIMQPVMSYERGYCRPECTRCSELCPAGAIRPITREDKSSTQIGHAVWLKKNCLPLTDGVKCGNCARHCPTGAIEMVPSDPDDEQSPAIPAVNENRCIGCGACENLCPARPFSAIYVEGHEVHKEV